MVYFQHNIGEKTPQEELAIMVEYEPIFKQLNQKLREDMVSDEEKYKNIAQNLNEMQL